MFDYLFKRPMLFCGVLCSVIAVVGYYFSVTLLLFGIACAGAFCILLFGKKHTALIIPLILIFLMVLSSINAYSFIEKTNTYIGKTVFCEFVVKENVNKGSYSKAEIEIISADNILKGKTADIVYYNDILEVGKYYGGDIKFREITDEYKLMDYGANVFFSGSLKEVKQIPQEHDGILCAAEKIRSYIKETAFGYLGYSEASTLCAILFGEQSFFTNEFVGNIKGAGVSHVMVVSGMHLAVMVSFFTKLLDFITYNRFIKAVCIFAVVLFLTVICGFTVSMQRAGITYVLFAFSLLLNRKNTPANTLGAAVSIILITSPFTIFNVAFQLSALSTFGILAVALPVIDYLETENFIKCPFLSFLSTQIILSLSAMILTLPVTIYIFGYISTVGILTNVLISNIITITLCVGILGIITSLISVSLTAIVMMPCDGLLKYTNNVIDIFGGWKFSVLPLPVFGVVFAIFIIICIFWLLLACKKRQNVLKLKEIHGKIIKEGGRNKWR